jgi:hypothetical protein
MNNYDAISTMLEGAKHANWPNYACRIGPTFLMRNLIKARIINAKSKPTIGFTHKKNWRAELTMTWTNQASLHCVF